MYTTPDSACCKPIIPRFLKKTRIFDRRNRPQTCRGGLGEESLQFVHAFFARADAIFVFLRDFVASKLTFTRKCTTSSGASGRRTEIQWSLFMWYAGLVEQPSAPRRFGKIC